jgi:hypothetical protein
MRWRRIFKTKVFIRWALKAGLSDTALLTAVQEIAQGLIAGDLGGGVLKNERANVSPRELEALRELARDLLELNERQIDAQTKIGAFEEIIN